MVQTTFTLRGHSGPLVLLHAIETEKGSASSKMKRTVTATGCRKKRRTAKVSGSAVKVRIAS